MTRPSSCEASQWLGWQPTDRATLTFVVRGREMLLIRKQRGLGAGKINGPGGKLDPGETFEQSAVREVQEELLCTPIGLELAGTLAFQFADGYGIFVGVYRASNIEGIARETEEAVPLWTPLAQIPYGEMWADDELWLPWLLDGKKFAGRFIFDGDDMVCWQLEQRSTVSLDVAEAVAPRVEGEKLVGP